MTAPYFKMPYSTTPDILRQRKGRRPFRTSVKKAEWNVAAGRSSLNFKTTSKCRQCPRTLTWGDRSYDFDHRDNNPSNNSQRNCYLICKSCHGKFTKLTVKKGITFGVRTYKTIKRKVGYKKFKGRKLKVKRRRRRQRGLFPRSTIPRVTIPRIRF